ncbi:anthranilate synthase component II [Peribacillus butanolivorans]|uniref:anthranilate synthase component II n=1 Tax=Peribacillus TaxID=2675229 RepID=UPI0019144034|nr:MULTISPECIES: aminodeoxychorismate/anthranilate synthase component II [Peribacillus]MBK5445749.1 aminodeoxychorismate/anthranilate synthase component II [Peribacillus sp. TH24]MBK5459536.1 aminodeoxychorismate/anthranilate synthase component II [Peribacillus sp. TH27]MBK5481344.1 aminodeoxychorismate/anthranilate synthase component II [Peribacillus sp. TH16]MBK5497725.1 aminodeoxychorismate/anthranilate synthase component II [Peribacillus sp. TH14]MCO0598377.1 aminodeoxychorismate/anthranil
MILLIDNYDSFTYNLYQYLGEVEKEIIVKRNDEITIAEIEEMNPKAIVISPGPGRPEDAGISMEIIRSFYKKLPLLGICLGHQAIGATFGANVIGAKYIMHGKTSVIEHDGTGVFVNQNPQFPVMRYHSLVVERESLPNELTVTASAVDDGEIMALKHQDYPLYGLQFHPESIGTKIGKELLHEFYKIAETYQLEKKESIL